MTKSKKYFIVGVIFFFIMLIIIGIDIGSKTKAPWKKRVEEQDMGNK